MAKLPLHITERLRFIRDFLEHMERDIALEWSEIEKRLERGEIPEYGEYEAAMDFPLFREQFSARAIINELNALAEEVIHSKAEPVWRKKHKKNEKGDIPAPVWEQPIGTVWKLVEVHYEIRRSDIPDWDVYDNLRDMTNAFKHRRGFRRFSDIVEKSVVDMNEVQYLATFENAKKILNAIKPFLMSVSAL